MEHSQTNNTGQEINTRKTGKTLFIFAGVLIVLFLVWYLVFQSVSTVKYVKYLDNLNDNLLKKEIGQFLNTAPAEEELERLIQVLGKKAYLDARMKMAESDSVRLVINLPDSLIFIEIKGMTVHTVKIIKYKSSGLIQNMPDMVKIDWLSLPFKVLNTYSTIPHEPIVIKHAPADTTEAQNMPETVPEPDDLKVYFTYETNKNLILHFNQIEEGKMDGVFLQRLKRNWKKLRKSVSIMVRFQKSYFTLSLELSVSRQDAKTIFRALPNYPQITILL